MRLEVAGIQRVGVPFHTGKSIIYGNIGNCDNLQMML